MLKNVRFIRQKSKIENGHDEEKHRKVGKITKRRIHYALRPYAGHEITFDAIDSILPRYIAGIYYLRGVSKTHFGQAGVFLPETPPPPLLYPRWGGGWPLKVEGRGDRHEFFARPL